MGFTKRTNPDGTVTLWNSSGYAGKISATDKTFVANLSQKKTPPLPLTVLPDSFVTNQGSTVSEAAKKMTTVGRAEKIRFRENSTVLVDMDGVLADFGGSLETLWNNHPVAIANEWFPLTLPDEPTMKIKEQLEHRWGPDAKRLFHTIINSGTFYRDLPPLPGAIEGINNLVNRGHSVYICTRPSRHVQTCGEEKIAWARHHLGEEFGERTIVIRDKTLVKGHYLIDDKPDVTGKQTPTWEHVVYAAPYNTSDITWSAIEG